MLLPKDLIDDLETGDVKRAHEMTLRESPTPDDYAIWNTQPIIRGGLGSALGIGGVAGGANFGQWQQQQAFQTQNMIFRQNTGGGLW